MISQTGSTGRSASPRRARHPAATSTSLLLRWESSALRESPVSLESETSTRPVEMPGLDDLRQSPASRLAPAFPAKQATDDSIQRASVNGAAPEHVQPLPFFAQRGSGARKREQLAVRPDLSGR